jgi:ATP-dependent Clp protease adaptor protein ClpS
MSRFAVAEEGAGAAVSAPVEEPAVEVVRETTKKKKPKPKRQPPYHVILWNDNDHSYHYVILMLRALCGHPTETGYQLAKEVDTRGRAVVMTTTLERAELKRDQIHAYGKDDLIAGCAGSMSATIEPAEV